MYYVIDALKTLAATAALLLVCGAFWFAVDAFWTKVVAQEREQQARRRSK